MVPVRGQSTIIPKLVGFLRTVAGALLVRRGGNPLGAILSPASSGDGKGISPTI